MAQDPRKFTIGGKNCSRTQLGGVPEINGHQKSWFDEVRNISGVDTNSRVSKGLHAIVKTVDAGNGRIWDTNGVLNKVFEGGSGNANAVESEPARKLIKPDVINRGVFAAKSVAEKANSGSFGVDDIPGVIQDLSVLVKSVESIFVNPLDTGSAPEMKCEATHYASSLINVAPKFKFLFVTEFIFNDRFDVDFMDIKPATFVKQFDRPVVTMEYDDINMYNFRTKVLKSVQYGPATMTMYDDSDGNVTQFITRYLSLMSPVFASTAEGTVFEDTGLVQNANIGSASSRTLDNIGTAPLQRPSTYYTDNTTHPKTILKEIRVYHVFYSGTRFDLYRFINPRIMETSFEQLTMEDTNVTTATIQFNYDKLSVIANATAISNPEDIGRLAVASGIGGERGIVVTTGPTTTGNMNDNDKVDSNSWASKFPIIGSIQKVAGAVGSISKKFF